MAIWKGRGSKHPLAFQARRKRDEIAKQNHPKVACLVGGPYLNLKELFSLPGIFDQP